MNIGYACIALGAPGTKMKSCIRKNADEQNLKSIIEQNLQSLDRLVEYNLRNNIKLFRISSDLIPFGSSPVNKIKWEELYHESFEKIGSKLKQGKIRVSMHPGQYTVLNSPNDDVVERAVQDLIYHEKVLDCLGTSIENKIVLHIGGIYDNKTIAVERFIHNYKKLNESIKQRLIIENDDKCYNISEVINIGINTGIPVVFDNLHHRVNICEVDKNDEYWIIQSKKTWTAKDGQQKIHYSQQNFDKKPGSHSSTVKASEFIQFFISLNNKELDVMLEVKDKNLSAIKCINCTIGKKQIQELEMEWSKYKYKILENSPTNYQQIRKLLKDKTAYPVEEFYYLIEDALNKEPNLGYLVNAAQHVWGYFKNSATAEEKNHFAKMINNFIQGKSKILSIKSFLWKMTLKYNEQYLKSSYYFEL